MNAIFAAALDLQEFCDKLGWQSCFIGGLAVQRWGEPRMTRDADLTLLTGFGTEEAFIDTLLDTFEGRRDDARAFALKHRVLLARHSNNTPFDIALGALPFEEDSVLRSSLWNIGEGELRTCSADDLVIHKVFAGRDQDWLDVRGILVRSGQGLDLNLIECELKPLLELKNSLSNLDKLYQLIEELL
ncbi:MAG: hypothetical protein ACO3JG_12295 [Luteolibacter sp.]